MILSANAFLTGGALCFGASRPAMGFGFLTMAFLAFSPAHADLPAFPGAEGAGAAAVGGRGGIVCKVTNLADSGPGSLRECVNMEGPRVVVFRVGGTIVLNSQLNISNPYITIAGQTAPGGGIQIRASDTNWSGSRLLRVATGDVIIRYIRLRPGANGNRITAVTAGWSGASRVIFDHVSISWSFDGNGFSVWSGPSDITLQNSIVAENRTNIVSGSGSESGALAIKNLDLHNNFIANASHRNPLLKTESIRYINNINYNWSSYASRTSGGVNGDFVSNLYTPGPASKGSRAQQEIQFNPYSEEMASPERAIQRDPSLYVAGNEGGQSGMDPQTDNWPYTRWVGPSENHGVLGSAPETWKRSEPLAHAGIPITVRHVSELEEHILPTVGASRRLDCEGHWVHNRDSIDNRVIDEYHANGGKIPSSSSTEAEFGGFPIIGSGAPCADTSGDGIPDEWLKANGLDYTNPTLGRTIHGSGYSYLELYINGLGVERSSPASPGSIRVE